MIAKQRTKQGETRYTFYRIRGTAPKQRGRVTDLLTSGPSLTSAQAGPSTVSTTIIITALHANSPSPSVYRYGHRYGHRHGHRHVFLLQGAGKSSGLRPQFFIRLTQRSSSFLIICCMISVRMSLFTLLPYFSKMSSPAWTMPSTRFAQ